MLNVLNRFPRRNFAPRSLKANNRGRKKTRNARALARTYIMCILRLNTHIILRDIISVCVFFVVIIFLRNYPRPFPVPIICFPFRGRYDFTKFHVRTPGADGNGQVSKLTGSGAEWKSHPSQLVNKNYKPRDDCTCN